MVGNGGILVGLDAEGRSAEAFKEAIALGEAWGCPVYAIHVVDLGDYMSVLGALDARAKVVPNLEEQVQSWTSALLPEGASPPKLRVLIGNPIKVLLRRAAALNVSLIVVGGHAPTVLRGRLLGATAERLVRASDRPVLVRRMPPTTGPILVPVDLSEESEIALEIGAHLAGSRGVPLLALYVYPHVELPLTGVPGVEAAIEEHRAIQHSAFRDLVGRVVTEITPRVFIERGSPRARIAKCAIGEGVDLVVMGAHGRTGLARWSLGSTTEHVLGHTDLSVLVVKKSDRSFLLDETGDVPGVREGGAL